jgi:hypothetical protein
MHFKTRLQRKIPNVDVTLRSRWIVGLANGQLNSGSQNSIKTRPTASLPKTIE